MAKYSVKAPFLGAKNTVFTFNDVIEEEDIIPSELEKRLKDGYVVKIEEKEDSKKKVSLDKNEKS
jgi:hypothetical protein